MECWGMAFDEAGWGFNFFSIKNMAGWPYGFLCIFAGLSIFLWGFRYFCGAFGIFGRFFPKRPSAAHFV
jgi:hypothetical protein